MQKSAALDVITLLRAIALAAALVGLAIVLAGLAYGMVAGGVRPLGFVNMAAALGMMGLIGGLVCAAVLTIARWVVARSTFSSPDAGGPPP